MAILLVTMLHACSMLDINNDSYGFFFVYGSIVHCGVPLFVMVFGALLLQKPCSAKLFFAKRFARVLIPFLFWTVPVYIIGVLTHRYNSIQSFGDACLYFFPYLLQNDIQMYQWFVHMILTLYLLTPPAATCTDTIFKTLSTYLLSGMGTRSYPTIFIPRYICFALCLSAILFFRYLYRRLLYLSLHCQ